MLLTAGEAVKTARVSRDTLHRWRKRGKIKATKTGSGRWRFDEVSLKAFLGEPETDRKADAERELQEALAWLEESYRIATGGRT